MRQQLADPHLSIALAWRLNDHDAAWGDRDGFQHDQNFLVAVPHMLLSFTNCSTSWRPDLRQQPLANASVCWLDGSKSTEKHQQAQWVATQIEDARSTPDAPGNDAGRAHWNFERGATAAAIAWTGLDEVVLAVEVHLDGSSIYRSAPEHITRSPKSIRRWACRGSRSLVPCRPGHHEALHEVEKIEGVTYAIHLPAVRGAGARRRVQGEWKRLCRARTAHSIYGPEMECTSWWLLGKEQSFNGI